MNYYQLRKGTLQIVYSPNLWLSVIWTRGSGSDNKHILNRDPLLNSECAEIAVFDPKESDINKWNTHQYVEGSSYGVKTYVPIPEVLEVAAKIAHSQGELWFATKMIESKATTTEQLVASVRAAIKDRNATR